MTAVRRLGPAAKEELLVRLGNVLRNHPDIGFAVVFGSFLEGNGFRDIDVGVWTTSSADARLDLELAGSLSAALDLPVDVRRLNDAPVPFLFHALRGRAVVVRDDVALAAIMERTAREYHDRAPLLRWATRDAFGR